MTLFASEWAAQQWAQANLRPTSDSASSGNRREDDRPPRRVFAESNGVAGRLAGRVSHSQSS